MKWLLSIITLLSFNIASAQLSGTYTIDPNGTSGNNFVNFKQAVSYLASYGVNGPVVFKVADGIYAEKIGLGMISGSSAKNTIIFESASSDSSKVILTDPSSTSSVLNYTLYLMGASYVTFKNLTIERSGAKEYGRVVVIDQGTHHIAFQNNRIIASNNGSTTTACFYSANYADSSNTFANNLLKYGFYGFYFSSGNASIYENNNVFTGNILDSQFVSGIHLLLQKSCTINNNKITNLRSGAYNNYSIHGIYLDACIGSTSSAALIYNNSASMTAVATNAYAYGIYINNCSNLLVAHNNTLIEIPGTSTGRGLYVNQSSSAAANNNVYNNNLIVKGKGYPAEITSNGKYGISNSNNNNLFSTNGLVARHATNDYYSLNTWGSATSFETNGISTDPRYYSSTDLHVRAIPLNGSAKSLTVILKDFDGENRSSSSSDIGADEFVPLNNDLEIIGILTPVSKSCGDSFSQIAVVIKNEGTDSQNNFSVEITLSGSAIDTIVENYNAKMGSLDIDTLYISTPINTYNGRTFQLKAYSKLSSDEYKWNDTVTNSFSTRTVPKAPTVTNVARCGPGKVTLTAKGPGSQTISWFNSITGTTSLDTGNSILVGPITTTTYFAQYGGDYFYKAGPKDTTMGTAAYYNAYDALPTYLKVYKTMYLDSVTVYANGAGDVGFRLLDSSTNKVVGTAKQTVSGTGKHIIYVGLEIEPGSYKVDASGTTTAGLLRNSTGASWPYNLNNIMSITGTAYQPSYYYFFYDWKVSVRTCPSPRVPVTVTINNLPTGGVLEKDSIFEGAYKFGTTTAPDSVCAGKRLDYKLIPPTGYNHEEYDSIWQVQLTIQSSNNTPVTDTSFRIPSKNKNGVLSFTPSLSLGNTTVNIKVKYVNLITGCESSLNRYIYISSAPVSGFTADTVCLGKSTQIRTAANAGTGSVYYLYRLGDGSISVKASLNYIYASAGKYNITQIVTNSNGCIDSTTKTVIVNPAPVASFDYNDACVGAEVQFNNTSINSDSADYLWNFGDGDKSTDKSPIHSYKKPGTYYVTLQISESTGCINSIIKPVNIYLNPIADFSVKNICKGDFALFENKSNTINDTASKNIWYFGDGETSVEKSPKYLYYSADTYAVTLVTTNSNGCVDSFIQQVVVNNLPEAEFATIGSCVGMPVKFSSLSTITNGSISEYVWYFGDGDSSVNENPEHIYKSPGNYEILLKVNSSTNCGDSISKKIKIYSLPDADFSYNINEKTVQFNANDTGGAVYKWYFGDGDSSSGKVVSHIYSGKGKYAVRLVVLNNEGCSKAYTDTIEIYNTGIKGNDESFFVNIYPNPFDHNLNIVYDLKNNSKVEIKLYDVTGKSIFTIADGEQSSGKHKYLLNTSKYNIPAGSYILKLSINGDNKTYKLIHLK